MSTVGHTRNKKELVKLLFQLEPNSWHGSASETLWAEKIDENRFRLRNVPFFAFDVSVEDIVFATERDGRLEFDGVSIRGGHSTYRIIISENILTKKIAAAWKRLEEIGCTYEQGPGRLRSIDIPPSTDIYRAYEFLKKGEQEGTWTFEEGHCGHLLLKSR